jgi:hypothetical protein
VVVVEHLKVCSRKQFTTDLAPCELTLFSRHKKAFESAFDVVSVSEERRNRNRCNESVLQRNRARICIQYAITKQHQFLDGRLL